jgi:hypothetical protein
MSISVTIDQDTFSYKTINGETSWIVSTGSSNSWKDKVGKTVPYTMFSLLFSMATANGFGSHDFAKIAVPDLDSRVLSAALNRVTRSNSRSRSEDDEIKPVSRKSTLRQSIKLF